VKIRDGPAAVTGDADLLSLCREYHRTAWEDNDSWANDPEESEDDEILFVPESDGKGFQWRRYLHWNPFLFA
jgi:hypothetical protein